MRKIKFVKSMNELSFGNEEEYITPNTKETCESSGDENSGKSEK